MNQFKKHSFLFRFGALVGWLVLFSLTVSCGNDAENSVAEVGEYDISKLELRKRIEAFKARMGDGFTDNGQFRRSILDQIINEKLMLTYAHDAKFDKGPLAEQEKERIEIQGLLNAYFNKFVTSSVNVDEQELIEYFTRFNTKLKARHLFSTSKHSADSLYALLKTGADFATLARKTFKNKELQNSGGSLGYFTVDDMDPFFEEAAYSLAVGEISEPVKTAYGYSVIQLEERVANPLITENQFAAKKGQLHTFVTNRKREMLARDHVDSIANSYQIVFNEPILQNLFKEIKSITSMNDAEVASANMEAIAGEQLISFNGGSWTVREFQQRAKFTSREQQAWVRNEHTLREFIRGLVARNRMLEVARAEKLDQTDDFKSDVEYQFETYLISRVERLIESQVQVPVDSAKSYFDADPNRFAMPPQIAVRTIELNNIDIANEVRSRLEKGESFQKLQDTFNNQSKNQPLEFYTPQQFGGLAPTVFELKPGDWTGPHNVDQTLMFFQCIEMRPARKRTFAEAKTDVESTLQMMFHDKLRKAFLSEMRQKTPNKIYSDEIRSLY